MDMTLIQGTISGLKTAADIAKSLMELKSISDVQAKVIELQSAILAAQSSALSANADQAAMVDEIRALKEETLFVIVLTLIGIFLALGEHGVDQPRQFVRSSGYRFGLIHARAHSTEVRTQRRLTAAQRHCVVLASLARHAVRGDELGGDQFDGVAMLAEQAGPVVGAGAGFHADQARRELGDQRQELFPIYLGFDQFRLAVFIHAMNRKDGLGQINSNDDNAHDFPLLRC